MGYFTLKIRLGSVVNISQQRAVSFACTLPYPENKKGPYIMTTILMDDELLQEISLPCTPQVNLAIWKSSAISTSL